jgi:hypothetical protein
VDERVTEVEQAAIKMVRETADWLGRVYDGDTPLRRALLIVCELALRTESPSEPPAPPVERDTRTEEELRVALEWALGGHPYLNYNAELGEWHCDECIAPFQEGRWTDFQHADDCPGNVHRAALCAGETQRGKE